jgi:hypothetical protein
MRICHSPISHYGERIIERIKRHCDAVGERLNRTKHMKQRMDRTRLLTISADYRNSSVRTVTNRPALAGELFDNSVS